PVAADLGGRAGTADEGDIRAIGLHRVDGIRQPRRLPPEGDQRAVGRPCRSKPGNSGSDLPDTGPIRIHDGQSGLGVVWVVAESVGRKHNASAIGRPGRIEYRVGQTDQPVAISVNEADTALTIEGDALAVRRPAGMWA